MAKYKDLLQQSEAEKNEQEDQFRVKEGEQQLASDILATERSLAIKQNELLKAKGAYPLNAQKIIDLQIEVEGLEDGLKRLKALKEELF